MGENEMLNACVRFVKKNTVLAIAMAAALITMCIVPPDAAYAGYLDFKTLTCLFCVLAVVCALKNVRFFTFLARKIVQLTGNARMAILALVYITFIGSMLIANDMALLTFLPLGYYVLAATGQMKYLAFTFIMQNIAANLGGMLTPFGNPQNLYLYTRFSIPNGEFVSIMWPPFALAIVIVFRAIPYWIGLIVIPAALLILDRKALKQVDYALLFTFVCFFLFAGNMARIPAVRSFFSAALEKSTLLMSAASCQVISNVPTAILLSQFTDNYRELLWGVNIGGTGTLIASLASLITFREYTRIYPGRAGYYIARFSAFNFGFLAVMLLFCQLLR